MIIEKKIKIAGDVYKALGEGNPISDSDLKSAIKTFREIIKTLDAFGPEFRLVTRDLHMKALTLEGYLFCRKLK